MNEKSRGTHPEEVPAQRAPSSQEMPTAPLAPNDAEKTLSTLDDQGTVSLDADAPYQSAPFYTAPTQQVAPPTFTQPAQGYGQAVPLGNAPQTVYQAPVQAVPPPHFSDVANVYAQSSNVLQPGQPGAFPPPRKHRRAAWLVAILLFALLLISGGVAFAIVQANASTPTRTLLKFCDGLKKQDVQEVYDTYSSEARGRTSLADLQQSFSTLKELLHLQFRACTVSNVQENGATATGQITLTTQATLLGVTTSVNSTTTVDLVLENGTWKVNASSTTTVPNLTVPTFPPFPTPTTANQ